MQQHVLDFQAQLDNDIEEHTLYPDQAKAIWEMGLAAWIALQTGGYEE